MKKRIAAPVVVPVFLLCVVWLQGLPAQEFGRNKIVYEKFDFRILKTPNFDVFTYPEGSPGVLSAVPMLERWHFRLSSFFGFSPDSRLPIILYASHPDFAQTNTISGLISQGIGGVTETGHESMIIPLTGVNAENDHVLGHEMVHAFSFFSSEPVRGVQDLSMIPLWFSEGLAEYLSLGRESVLTSVWLRDAVLNSRLPSLSALELDPEASPYRFGHALWAYISGRWGDEKAAGFFRESLKSGVPAASESAFGMSLPKLLKAWNDSVSSWVEESLRKRAFDTVPGVPVLQEARDVNLAPVVSPDGTLLAFFSRRDLFTLDLYIVEVATGKVIRKITSASGSRPDDLSFMNVSGTFSPDSSRFAFIVVDRGNSGIDVMNLGTGKIEHSIRLPDIQAVLHAVWSPDGSSLGLSAISGGVSDLFLYDFAARSLKRLTDDIYSDLQPDWTPDGKYLVFSTDRGEGSDTEVSKFAPLALASCEVETGRVAVLGSAGTANLANPVMAPDGKSLYFLAAFDGFPDIYRYFPETDRLYRITRVRTGVTGLTELSAALTVARNTGELYFNVFENRGYAVYMLPGSMPDDSALVSSEMLGSGAFPFPAGGEEEALPPEDGAEGIVSAYLDDPLAGLPAADTFETERYNPVLSLSQIGNFTLGISFTGSGAVVFGNILLVFDDFLRNHLLATTLSVRGDYIKDFSADITYINREKRLNWGLSFSHQPERHSSYTLEDLPPGEDGLEREEYVLTTERVYRETVSLLSAYPFSQSLRMEAGFGVSLLNFEYSEVRHLASGGEVISETENSLPAPGTMYLARPRLSLVGDSSFFGFTSPVRGRRFRLDAEPVLGSLNFLSVYADFRQYFFSRPASLAFRVLHAGRYLGDSESEILAPMYLGNPSLVRGYEAGLLDFDSCSPDGGDCLTYNSLLGTKAAVFNAELRIPILGNRDLGLLNFPYLPVTLAGFLDAGLVWSGGESPVERGPVVSAGGAVYINLMGAIIGQVYYVYPFQNPGAHWGVSIGVGF